MIRILQQDNRATKAIFAVVIGLAIIAMVVTLVPGIFDNGTANNGTVYATVRSPGVLGRISGDNEQITNEEVESSARAQLRQNQLPDYYLPFILARAGQQQIERAILVREADQLGLQVSDADLQHELRTGALGQYFFPNGQFIGDDKYQSFVEQNFGIPVGKFESEVKQDMELQRLEAMVTGAVTVSDAAAREAFRKQGEKVRFDYAVLSLADLKNTINPPDAELEQYFKTNAARYATAVPEARKITFFAVDPSNLPGGAPKASDAEIQAYYNAHQTDYKQPEQVKTRHILITVPKGADAKTDAAAKAKAEDLLRQVKAGGNFAELAKKYSEDPGSKDQGGSLPMIPTSSLDHAYAQAAMALSPGQTSDVVRSQFGYHIIQTEQKQAAATRSLAEVKDEIAGKLAGQKFTEAQSSYANQLAAEAKKNGMEATAKAHSLPLSTTDYLGRNGTIPSLPDSASLVTAAFGVAKGAAPQAASAGQGYAVFQVADVQAAHAPSFADWKSHVLDDYRNQKAPELLTAQLRKLDERAKQLGDLHKAAEQMKVAVKTSDYVSREAQVPELGSLSGDAAQIFNLPKGGISGPITEGPNGAVAQLVDRQQPTPQEINANLEATRGKLLDQQRSETFNLFAGSLMDRYERAGAIQYSRKPAGLPLGS